MALKGSKRDCFLFGRWFLSNKSVEASDSIGVDLVGLVKTNTKRLCKAMIEESTKDQPGRSYIVLRSKHMAPRERPLLAIGYKYN